ncbi:LuxR C-terminal-related transcriptional regulator [Streptomyces lunaelactis]|uniref:LuxR C-terminal-related transcriptional regulator n=1 Tax=Streptomyces lunaelactis TaxID=1535768 RepID=UPI001584EA4A|nr:helix-turn-helix transcriptional regulator [Streptomyces lunaelactis]NUK23939.1 helix-turn-helix transcriptional regulator [Streptomyces lunaelactis]
MTAPAPITQLTPAERRIAQHVVNGLPARQIAVTETLSHHAVRAHMVSLRRKLHCPERCSLAVITHRLLSANEATAPAPDTPAPDLNTEQTNLLKAVAEHTKPLDIARGANMAPADLRAALVQLLADTGATDTTRLVARAHGWNLLNAQQTSTVRSGASK